MEMSRFLENFPPSVGTFSLSNEVILIILKNSEKVIINEGMCIFVITRVSDHFGIIALIKCLLVI